MVNRRENREERKRKRRERDKEKERGGEEEGVVNVSRG